MEATKLNVRRGGFGVGGAECPRERILLEERFMLEAVLVKMTGFLQAKQEGNYVSDRCLFSSLGY
jgi:hypothetical protein